MDNSYLNYLESAVSFAITHGYVYESDYDETELDYIRREVKDYTGEDIELR